MTPKDIDELWPSISASLNQKLLAVHCDPQYIRHHNWVTRRRRHERLNYSALNGISLSNLFSQGSGICAEEVAKRLQEPWVNRYLADTTRLRRIRTHRHCGRVHKTCTDSSQQGTSTERGRGHKVLPLTKKLYDAC